VGAVDAIIAGLAFGAWWAIVVGVAVASGGLTSFPDWGLDGERFVFQRRDFIPGFVGEDFEFIHIIVHQHANGRHLLVNHRHHNEARHKRGDANGRGRDGGNVCGGRHDASCFQFFNLSTELAPSPP